MKTENLIKILSIQTASYKQWRMFAYIIRELKKIEGCTFKVNRGNIYATKGKAAFFPCVVAHMDTVHSIESNLTVLRMGNNLTAFNVHSMRQVGIGGDDKVGIFIALECFKLFNNIKIAFFVNEEVGCAGSYLADKAFFKNVGYVLQCDRKGNNDFVTKAGGTKLSSKQFLRDITGILYDYGYNTTSGLMTDVMALKELKINCSMANMSCGYYNPHLSAEYVNIPDVENCLDMVKEIITTLGAVHYQHIAEVAKLPVPSYGKTYPHYQSKYYSGGYEDYGWGGETSSQTAARSRTLNPNNYCEECWGQVAQHNGLCETCNKLYNNVQTGEQKII